MYLPIQNPYSSSPTQMRLPSHSVYIDEHAKHFSARFSTASAPQPHHTPPNDCPRSLPSRPLVNSSASTTANDRRHPVLSVSHGSNSPPSSVSFASLFFLDCSLIDTCTDFPVEPIVAVVIVCGCLDVLRGDDRISTN
ncbi:transient receptor potential cation channelsubfamily M member 7 [Striga asiatica]|uniref:Transient receptor potential cation channelsubfamily M member 7 n=1 Tax=Striga asiatica TaxID=4170 RepID=A0A5A7NW66_STRAF|nr:transient receptor potential cation channelsubfamily M member 7 [Striga asiatica]